MSSVMTVQAPECLRLPMDVPSKLLLGPGPSNPPPRVIKAMANPLLGHLHPEFVKIMDEVKEGLKYLFQTHSKYTFCVSGTGHAGMEAVLVNLLEPKDVILIAKNGIWGERAAIMASRIEADVRFVEKPAGEAFTLGEIGEVLRRHQPSVFFIVHVESSTGVMQPLQGIGDLCKRNGCLFVVDCVASLGGTPFFMDAWGVDVAYTGSQKVLSCPPSLAPIAMTEEVLIKIKTRSAAPRSYYFDFQLLTNYWNCENEPRKYHHTGPISSVYALREGLAEVIEEGLEQTWSRHEECALLLHKGLQQLGLELFVRIPQWRAPTITAVKVPPGVSWKSVTELLMERFRVEISGGLGPTTGKIWRIGLLGYNCSQSNVELLLRHLSQVLSLHAGNIGSKL